jgi:hypothetical protein
MMKPFSQKNVLSIIAVVLLAALPAAAAELPDRGPIPFQSYDRNGDNVITEAEFDGVRAERMQKRAEEGYPMRRAGSAPAFSEFDADGNGQLTREELRAGQTKMMQERRGQRGMGPGGRMGGGMGPGGGMGR